MTATDLEILKRDFLAWSGGFEPDSRDQITVYVDYARPADLDPDEVTDALVDWMQSAAQESGTT